MGKRRSNNYSEGLYLQLPHKVLVEPIELDELWALKIPYVHNNGNKKKSKGVLSLKEVFEKFR